MKYTKYLINGKFVDIDSIQSNNIYFKMPLRIVGISVALVALTAITGMIPMAFIIDEARNTKARMIYFKRSGYKL